jgi:hypothetical protein
MKPADHAETVELSLGAGLSQLFLNANDNFNAGMRQTLFRGSCVQVRFRRGRVVSLGDAERAHGELVCGEFGSVKKVTKMKKRRRMMMMVWLVDEGRQANPSPLRVRLNEHEPTLHVKCLL